MGSQMQYDSSKIIDDVLPDFFLSFETVFLCVVLLSDFKSCLMRLSKISLRI